MQSARMRQLFYGQYLDERHLVLELHSRTSTETKGAATTALPAVLQAATNWRSWAKRSCVKWLDQTQEETAASKLSSETGFPMRSQL